MFKTEKRSFLAQIFNLRIFLLVVAIFIIAAAKNPPRKKNRILVFSKTNGWVHSSIPYGIAAIQKLGKENGWLIDTTTNSNLFTDQNLKNYQTVIFNNTIGNILNGEQQAAFERYIQAGGGYVGIHASAATEYDWSWFGKLNGAHLAQHPHNPNVRKATIEVVDRSHGSSKELPSRWEREDEWYNFKSFYPTIKVVAKLDENTYEGGTNGSNHPIAWYHEFDGGRAFYTGCGHTDESFSEPFFIKHLTGGIKYALGKGVKLDYAKAYSKAAPDPNRFKKTVLDADLDSPMELAISKDGEIYYTELGGTLSVYNTRTNQKNVLHKFEVITDGGTGLIGVTLDPNFERNNFLYVYYSPPAENDQISFRLSRFTIKEDKLILDSEKILLKVPVQKKSGSHHGGSFAWDKDGNLFISTGDSSSPFPSDGYSPLDERPGEEHYSLDAQRSSSNTNDFKGKILRIHPEEDGTYTIPEGNLFRKNTPNTLPEIYIMGVRNPYRIAINPQSSVLYWGDIGPDAGKDSIQGPKGYDEFNQAKKAGNYGWPYFIGDNQAYADWDFETKTAGPKFYPSAPVNQSPNNTGLKKLPPALSPMIWYPYEASEKFPEFGIGGRSAMVGSFYSFDKNVNSSNKFPEYYDGSLFVFDWMRNWVMSLHFDEDENYVRSEFFMPTTGDFRRPIDLVFGQDGVMYMLEYGSVYKADNDDARLVKIEYNTGNRPPVAKAGVTDSALTAHVFKTVYLTSEFKNIPGIENVAGKAPLRVLFNSDGTNDPDDDDKVSYQWYFDGKNEGSTARNPTYTYTEPGIYNAILKVTDSKGMTSADTVTIKVGNSKPEVFLNTKNNKSFYWENKPFNYQVKVLDEEDSKIDSSRIKVSLKYSPFPVTSNKSGGSQTDSISSPGFILLSNSDCKACHTKDKVSVGPSYMAIASRYKNQDGALDMLAEKIIKGGGGNWGNTYVMSAHPQLTQSEAKEITKYIFSLTDPKRETKAIKAKGTIEFNEHKEDEPQGQYVVEASYTDKGGKVIGPLTSSEKLIFINSKVKTVYADAHTGFARFANNLSPGSHKSYILLKNIDLTGIKSFNYHYSSSDKDGEIEVRMDSQAGPVISRVAFHSTGSWEKMEELKATLPSPVQGKHNLYFIMIKKTQPNDQLIKLDRIDFEE